MANVMILSVISLIGSIHMNLIAKSSGTMMIVWSCFSPASADFIGGKAHWDELHASGKVGYVMGAYDVGKIPYVGSPVYRYVVDRGNCVSDMELSAIQLVEIVESEYSDLSKWDKPANNILSSGLRKICLDHMNRARAERGDRPLE
jgi:hypothetical protein